MEKYCNSCRQSFAVEENSCPACGDALVLRPNGESRNGYRPDATPLPSPLQPQSATDREEATSEHELDLGSPVSAGQPGTGGPLSGASFVSWSAMLDQKKRPPTNSAAEPAVQIDPPSAARLRLDQGRLLPCPAEPASSPGRQEVQATLPEEPHGEPPDAEIDLGRPVTEPTGDSGPLSGASGVGWAALLRARKKYEDPNNPTLDYHNAGSSAAAGSAGPQLAVSQPPRAEASPPVASRSAGQGIEPRGVALGFLLGVGVCGALWLFGYEPPQSWRQWLGRPAPQSPTTPETLTPP
jgi:hypothetical protein